MDDCDNIVFVLLSESQNDIFISQCARREEFLHLPVLIEKVNENSKLVSLQAISVLVHDSNERRQRSTKHVRIAARKVVFEKPVQCLLQLFGRKVGVAHVRAKRSARTVRPASEAYASAGRRTGRSTLRKGVRVAKNLNQLLQRSAHDDLVVRTRQNVLEDAVEKGEALGGLLTKNHGRAKVGQLARKGCACLTRDGSSRARIPRISPASRVASRLLDELDNAILLGDQRHVHLHHLNFGITLGQP